MQQTLDDAKTEADALKILGSLSKWTLADDNLVSVGEYNRLANASIIEERRFGCQRILHSRENVPVNLRTLLSRIYLGHCQLCDFWFLKRDNQPYFEVHHLDPTKGHHPKNVVVVCGNCHNQFEHSHVSTRFNDAHWLIEANFNQKSYNVNQILTHEKVDFTKEIFV